MRLKTGLYIAKENKISIEIIETSNNRLFVGVNVNGIIGTI